MDTTALRNTIIGRTYDIIASSVYLWGRRRRRNLFDSNKE